MPGDTIGHYTLLESIGLGGNATVFRAQSEQFGIVAVKVLHPGKLTEVDIKRFYREFEAMHRLDHPNIIKVYEIGEHGNYPWLSMELITGGDLNTFIQKWNDPTAPPSNKYQQIHHFMVQLSAALQCVHQNQFIHRDLKPSNILMTESAVPKLTDFGGVKNTSHAVVTELTKLGSLVGTVAFMAPEQILGEEIDHRSDLYTLGAMLYMSLTGQKPLEASTMAEYLAKHLYETPVHPCTINPEIPQYLGNLCDILLQKTPKERLPSAQAVQKFLRQEKSLETPIGLEIPIQALLQWEQTHDQGIIILNSSKGLGTQQMLNHLQAHWRSKNWSVIQDTQSLQKDQPNVVVLMSNQTDIDKTSLHSNTQHTYVITTHLTPALEGLRWPTHTVHLTALSMDQIQQIVQQYGIVGGYNTTLSAYLMKTHRGMLDYTIDFLSAHNSWIQTQIQSGQPTLHLDNIPLSPKSLSNLTVTWHNTSSKIQPFLAGLLVYHQPISITLLPKLWNTSPSQTQIILNRLEKDGFITQQEDEVDGLIQFAPFVLQTVLYEILPESLKMAWHQRIVGLIQQKRRLRTLDRIQLLEHLTALKDHVRARPHYEALMHSAGQESDWEKVRHWLIQIVEHTEIADLSLTLLQFAEQAYASIEDFPSALQYNQQIQQQGKSLPQTLANAYLYQHAPLEILKDDASIDTIIHTLSLDLERNQHIVYLRALQHFLFNRISSAQALWKQLSQIFNSTWMHRAEIGLAVIHDLQTQADTFPQLVTVHSEQQFGVWHQWHCERLISSGRWNQLEQYLTERIAFGHTSIEDDLFATWYDYLTGNATRAHERLIQMQPMMSTISDPSILLHYARLCGRMRLSVESTATNISFDPNRIENHQAQWNLLQGYDVSNTIETPLFWHRDFALLDLAQTETSEILREQIWKQISPESLGIQIQIAKIFSDNSKNPIWTDKHRHVLEKCARNRTGDFHAWQ